VPKEVNEKTSEGKVNVQHTGSVCILTWSDKMWL
jgi:hypothetical protein